MRFIHVLKYMDEVLAIASAIGEYIHHKDESIFADDVLKQLQSAAHDAFGAEADTLVDEDKIRAGIVLIIDGLEPLFDDED